MTDPTTDPVVDSLTSSAHDSASAPLGISAHDPAPAAAELSATGTVTGAATSPSTPTGAAEGRPTRPLSICVFLSAADLPDRYTAPAREFAELLGRAGHTLVWGGSESGLMKVVADGVQQSGGRLVGVSVEFLRAKARADADEMVIAPDLATRKAELLRRSDAVVVMVGGTGTLDEATEILELKKHGLHAKPVVLLNSAGFYDGLAAQFRRMEEEGFLPLPLSELVHFSDDGADALAYLQEHT